MTEYERQKITNPVKRIRKYCLECCKSSPKEVDLCPATNCWLHDMRMGKNPFRKKIVHTEEERAKICARLAEGRKHD